MSCEVILFCNTDVLLDTDILIRKEVNIDLKRKKLTIKYKETDLVFKTLNNSIDMHIMTYSTMHEILHQKNSITSHLHVNFESLHLQTNYKLNLHSNLLCLIINTHSNYILSLMTYTYNFTLTQKHHQFSYLYKSQSFHSNSSIWQYIIYLFISITSQSHQHLTVILIQNLFSYNVISKASNHCHIFKFIEHTD